MENVNGVMPVYDLNCNRGGYGYDGMMGGWVWIFLLFALLGNGGWGNNWGNQGFGWDATATFANGAMTRNEIRDGFNNQDTQNGIRGIQQGLCDGFYAVNTTTLQGFNGIQRDLCQGFNGVNAGLAENRFAMQNCCCTLERNADYNTQRILDKLCNMEANAKDAQIADLREKLAVSNLQVSQQAQNAAIIGALRPFPQPAYITCSPYQSANLGCGFNGCGNC